MPVLGHLRHWCSRDGVGTVSPIEQEGMSRQMRHFSFRATLFTLMLAVLLTAVLLLGTAAFLYSRYAAGNLGDADAIFVRRPGLPIAVATADCVPIIIEAVGAVAVVHAGWRGAAAGVVPAALSALAAAGCQPQRAAIGPAIGPCCYEVGQEVTEQFAGYAAETTWGSPSVDIPSFVAAQLAGLELWRSPECTFTSARLNSWRRDATDRRQVAVAWLPMN